MYIYMYRNIILLNYFLNGHIKQMAEKVDVSMMFARAREKSKELNFLQVLYELLNFPILHIFLNTETLFCFSEFYDYDLTILF